jgi:multiple sugar transport system substrate-binding protein
MARDRAEPDREGGRQEKEHVRQGIVNSTRHTVVRSHRKESIMSVARLSRRDVLRGLGLASGVAVVAACAPQPQPQQAATAAPAPTKAAPVATDTPAADANATATAVVNAKATENAIAAAARAAEDAKVFDLTQEQYLAKAEEDTKKASGEGKLVVEMLSAFGTIIEDKTQPHYWIIKNFMEKNPKIFVKYTPSSAYTGAFNEVILMRIASGDPPDCIYHYSSPIAYAARGTCLQLDDLMDGDPVANKAAFFEIALAQCQWDGKTWGIPLNGSPAAMWYNTDILQSKGLPTERDKMPKTLDELKELSAKMTQWEGDKLVMAGANPWSQSWSWPGQMVSNGGMIWDGAKYSINNPKNTDLIKYWIKWLDEQYKGDIDLLAKQGNLTGAYPDNAFGMKLQAICTDGLWALTHIPPEVKFEVAKMPIGPGGTKAATSNWPNLMFIPKGAKHPKEGFALSAYFATEGQYEWWDRWADVPVWKKFPEDRAPKDLISRVGQTKAVELTKFTRSCLPDLVVQWNSPVDDFATDEISRAVDTALHKKGDPQEVLDKAQQTVTAKLAEVVSSK